MPQVHVEQGKSDKVEHAKPEPAKADRTIPEPAKPDSSKVEPTGKFEMPKIDSPEASKPEPAKPEPGKIEYKIERPNGDPVDPKSSEPKSGGRTASGTEPIVPPANIPPAVPPVTVQTPPISLPLPEPRPLSGNESDKSKRTDALVPPLVPPMNLKEIPTPSKEPEGIKIPPLTPPLPGMNDPNLPPLTIPGGGSTSRSSPLADRSRIEKHSPDCRIYIVEGERVDPRRRQSVGFFNHSGKDITLTVEGESVVLRSSQFVRAQVPAEFVWKINGTKERRTSIPSAAPGVEVVIR